MKGYKLREEMIGNITLHKEQCINTVISKKEKLYKMVCV